jgi:DNA replication and repair protein RecF
VIRRLSVSHFRSYKMAEIETSRQMVVLTGNNGAGKTNLIEGISLFSPGRGLRRATIEEMGREGAEVGFSINLKTDDYMLGTGVDLGSPTRLARMNGENCAINVFAEVIRVIWLTPQMDGLFNGASSERRKFLDRIVLAVDSSHGSRVNALEKLLRGRNKLLEENAERRWLEALEKELAEVAVSVAAARAETVSRLSQIIALEAASPFPKARLSLSGLLEEEVLTKPSLDLEEAYRKSLHDNRYRDKAAGRTLEGPHRSDLIVHHRENGSLAERCSTGQQKALLIGLILAQAKLISTMAGFPPVILLDETVAHLDPLRRTSLFHALQALEGQVWMTGADTAVFDELKGLAEIFNVHENAVTLLSV